MLENGSLKYENLFYVTLTSHKMSGEDFSRNMTETAAVHLVGGRGII